MKQRFESVTIVLLCAAFAGVPVLAHGQKSLQWRFPQYWESGKMVRGTIYLEAGAVIAGNLKTINSGYRDFVGVKNYNDIDLWSAGHSAWAVGPDMSINIIHPDPNVNPAIVSWMKQNNVKLATTAVSNQDFDFIVIRENRGDYSTLYYIGGR